jgi:hypothetical protein
VLALRVIAIRRSAKSYFLSNYPKAFVNPEAKGRCAAPRDPDVSAVAMTFTARSFGSAHEASAPQELEAIFFYK